MSEERKLTNEQELLDWLEKNKTPSVKIILAHRKEKNFTKLLVLFIEYPNSFCFVVCDRYDKGFQIPENRILDYWEHAGHYSTLEKAFEAFNKKEN